MTRLRGLESAVAGTGAGLFAARCLAEASPAPWFVPVLAGATLASVLLILLLARLVRPNRLWPLALLWVYVLWPAQRVDLACACAAVAALGLAVANWPARLGLPIEPLVFVGGLVVYGTTLAPGVLPADAGEYQLVASVLGIAHPPGYPLFTLLGHLFTLLPFGSPAWRVNLFAAVTSAATLAVAARTARLLTGSRLAALAAALSLGGITTFWAQATTANIRSLVALFTALILMQAVSCARSRSTRDLALLGLFSGLGVTHHLSLALLLVPVVAFLPLADPGVLRRPAQVGAAALAFFGTFLVLLYLPIRSLSGASFDPARIDSVGRFVQHVLALGFRGDMLYFARAEFLPGRVAVWANILMMEYGGPLLALGALSSVLLLLRRPKIALLVLGVLVVNSATAITYRAPQTVEYLIPSYVALAAAIGYGTAWLVRIVSGPSGRGIAAGALLVLCAMPWAANAGSFRWLSRDRAPESEARALLAAAPPDATILANWHRATPLWYLQQVESLRPDVQVVYVYPEGSTPNEEVWLRRIREGLAEGPVLVTNRFAAFDSSGYRFAPAAGAWQVSDRPLADLPSGATPLAATFEGKIAFTGFWQSAVQVSAGRPVTIRLFWRPELPLERDYSFFVHLVSRDGNPLGQGDTTRDGRLYPPGDLAVEEFQLGVLPTARPGPYRLIAGVYVTVPGGWQRLQLPDGSDSVVLGEVNVTLAQQPAVTLHRIDQKWDGGLTLIGADWDSSLGGRLYLHWQTTGKQPGRLAATFERSAMQPVAAVVDVPSEPGYFTTVHGVPAGEDWLKLTLRRADGAVVRPVGPWGRSWGNAVVLPRFAPDDRYVNLGGEMAFVGQTPLPGQAGPGDAIRCTLRFVALRPLTEDYSVSLSLSPESRAWFAQDDTTPALGAIPTLKWTRGVRVSDPHTLQVPEDATTGGARFRLQVYDAFALRLLPVLDEALARSGQGQWIGLGELTVR